MYINRHKLEVNSDIAERLQTFISSDLYSAHSPIAKSEYWKYEGTKFQTSVTGNYVNIAGDIGYDVPSKSSFLEHNIQRAIRVITQPSRVINRVKRIFSSFFEVPRMMSYEQAFDAAMRHDEIADVDLSRFRVNHRELSKLKNVFIDTSSVKKHYENWSGYKADAGIILFHYYQNILRGYISETEVKTILEIGAGNGNFPAIFHHDWSPERIILVDLPETLAIAITFLSNLFPDANILTPNEARSNGLEGEYDFVFLTVDQLDLIPANAIDLAINCHSFMEMTHEQINVYFDLIQRASREAGYFFTANRAEKIPCDENAFTVEQLAPPNRFAEYPWKKGNEVLVYEVSRLSRLVQLDDISLRLERIHK